MRNQEGTEMSSYETNIQTTATAEQLMAVLTDPAAIRDWSPVPFDLDGLHGGALETGSEARVSGNLAGLRVGFDVTVHSASSDGLSLSAEGPVAMDVSYGLRPSARGSEVTASVSLGPTKGLSARVIGKATEALLAAGALDRAAGRIARAAESVVPAPLAV